MQSSTRKNLLIAACYAGTVVFGMMMGPKFQKENRNASTGRFIAFSAASQEKVGRVLNIIEENYVDPVKVDTLQNLAINQILTRLDPHSSYLPPVEARKFSETLDGKYNGIGVEYQMLNDTVTVTLVVSGGPAYKAGVKSGDQILTVNNKQIAGRRMSPLKIAALIGGRRGTEIKVEVKRQGSVLNFAVQRDRITISSIDAAYRLSPAVGYIKISKFGAQTAEDFLNTLKGLKDKGINDLILDLRGNGGGYLNAATSLADQFLPDKKLIVYTRGEHEPRTDYFATAQGLFEKGKLVILIDENSASASEIVAGAIQDLDRGIVIGRRSFGKGLVQEQFNFGDGSALNLTVARYYTPSGRSIQKPYKSGSEKYFGELSQRLKNGELSGKKYDSLYDKHKAFKTTSGKPIYGGGGIMPDIYVPIDTSSYNRLYYQMEASGVLDEFLYRYLIRRPRPESPQELAKKFVLSDTEYSKLLQMAESAKLHVGKEQSLVARKAVATELRRLLSRFYFGNEGYYKMQNQDDPVIARSLEVLKRP